MELYWLSASRGEWRGTPTPAGESGESTGAPEHALTIPILSPARAKIVPRRHILPLCSLKIDKARISLASPAVLASFPGHQWGAWPPAQRANPARPPHKTGAPLLGLVCLVLAQ